MILKQRTYAQGSLSVWISTCAHLSNSGGMVYMVERIKLSFKEKSLTITVRTISSSAESGDLDQCCLKNVR